MEVINAVKHYQRGIERCSGNVQRMLHCLQKLYYLPVTVQHLQETGVGRTVNALRKYEGDTGEAAKALVNKWKAMVAEAESSDEDVPNEKHRARTESPPPTSSSHKHNSSHSESHRDESRTEKSKSLHKNHTSSSHNEKRRDENSASHRSTKHSDQGHKRRYEDENRRTEEKRRRRNIEEEEEDEEEEEEGEEHACDSGHESHEEIEKEESDHVSVADSESSNRRDEEEEDIEEASEVEEIDTEEMAPEENHDDSSSATEYVPEVKVKHKSHSGKHNGISQSSHRIHTEHNTHSSHGGSSSRNHKHGQRQSDKFQEKSSYSVDHRHSKKIEGKSDSSLKVESSSSSNSSSVLGHKESKSKSKEKERNQEKERSREEGEKNEMQKREEIKKDFKDQKKDHKNKTHIPKQESKPSTSSSKSSVSKSDKSKDLSPKKVRVPVGGVEDGIDSFSGTSFADALGMMGMMDSVSKKKKKSGGSSSSKKSEGSSGNQVGISSKSSLKTKEVTPHKLLTQSEASPTTDDLNLLDPSMKLEPLDHLEMEVDVDATLPTITPNYRPLPHLNIDIPSRARARTLTEEEALSQVMSTKNQRTKVYSGVKSGKSWTTVPSLYDICVRVLQENIDALEYTGGVPYDLLKPVLTHATPEQLFALEHYNPYLVEDTDELWQSHVRRKFRNERRLDMETHREMFQRCVEESEAKLKALTLNIQNSMAKSLPVRQTKLAYVDSMAKPPRQVARKQAKFGTAHTTATTPMAKVQKLASPASSSASGNNSPVIHVPTPRTSHSVAKPKPRMAPLMQKTMKLAKSFKR